MRRYSSKQKQIPISQKVKKMFRYSPSYEAQKCYSKLPLRYSYASNTKTHLSKQNEINCEYSSVKQKNIESNECNDTSSWIAKLVSGIQDQDDQIKNLHKLSQIQNNSISDLPQDSQDYGQNQFLIQNNQVLFSQKYVNKPLKSLNFQKEVPITKPIKKSIKEAMIEIELKQNKQGLRGPPVTRANSSKKQASKISKLSSNEKKKQQKQINDGENKTLANKKFIQSKVTQAKGLKNSFLNKKQKSLTKRKVKTMEKAGEKSQQVINMNFSCSNDLQKKNSNILLQNQSCEQILTCKTSIINPGIFKKNSHNIKNQGQDLQTRKNSFIGKQDLSESKQQYKHVQQHCKNLNMKNLFCQDHLNYLNLQNHQQIRSNNINIETRKRIGSIKKNVLTNNQNSVFKQLLKQNQKTQNNPSELKIDFKQKQKQLQIKYSYLNSKRHSQFISNNKINDDQTILIELNQSPFPSQRQYKNKFYTKNLQIQHNLQHKSKKIIKNDQIEKQNALNIQILFNKLKLDPTKQFIQKSNLKLRGLTQVQKTQLGSIISKIHFQNAKFNFSSFQKQFKKINAQCTIKGCLSQQKLRINKNSQHKNDCLSNDNTAKLNNLDTKINNLENNISFQKKQHFQLIQVDTTTHRRRNSNIIKKKLFDEIKRISYLQQIAASQLQKNSRITDNDQSKQNDRQNGGFITKKKEHTNQQIQIIDDICKDPYIEGPSLSDIQLLSKRDILFKKMDTISISPLQQIKSNGINKIQICSAVGNDTCLIERLNKKLTSYIDKNQIQHTFRQFNLNFSELKKHIR